MKKKKRYYQPYNVNSNVWFYKNRNSFEFIVAPGFVVEGHLPRFIVQDRTLLAFINGTRKDARRK